MIGRPTSRVAGERKNTVGSEATREEDICCFGLAVGGPEIVRFPILLRCIMLSIRGWKGGTYFTYREVPVVKPEGRDAMAKA